ncbi:hypothetical protein CDEST_03129 [Colletotrichum destructivum]|uniref:Uncharacterized protein n=1 Tax=Colletotrichum destructivum TaxID=34406 RepID=A0AAX4I450_9PEZI|nr:hypothetical protein CDEST_03129 [Colletotrichum destructivum]
MTHLNTRATTRFCRVRNASFPTSHLWILGELVSCDICYNCCIARRPKRTSAGVGVVDSSVIRPAKACFRCFASTNPTPTSARFPDFTRVVPCLAPGERADRPTGGRSLCFALLCFHSFPSSLVRTLVVRCFMIRCTCTPVVALPTPRTSPHIASSGSSLQKQDVAHPAAPLRYMRWRPLRLLDLSRAATGVPRRLPFVSCVPPCSRLSKQGSRHPLFSFSLSSPPRPPSIVAGPCHTYHTGPPQPNPPRSSSSHLFAFNHSRSFFANINRPPVAGVAPRFPPISPRAFYRQYRRRRLCCCCCCLVNPASGSSRRPISLVLHINIHTTHTHTHTRTLRQRTFPPDIHEPIYDP